MREVADVGYRPVVGLGNHRQQAAPRLPTDRPPPCPPPAAVLVVLVVLLFPQLLLLLLGLLPFFRDFPEIDLWVGKIPRPV